MPNPSALPLEDGDTDPFYDPKYDPKSPQFEPPPEPEVKSKKRGGKNVDLNPHTANFFAKRGFCHDRVDRYERRMRFDQSLGRVVDEGGYYRDLFGFMDSVAFRRDIKGVYAIQTTSKQGLSAHIRSAITNQKEGDSRNPNRGFSLVHWLLAGNRFFVFGWEKPRHRWEVCVVEVTLEVVEAVQKGERLKLAGMIRRDPPEL